MSKFVLTNARTLVGGGDLSGDVNQVTIAATQKEMDVTNYNSAGWNEYIAGLGSAKVAVSGFWEANSAAQVIDTVAWAALGAVGGATIAPQGAADQAQCFLVDVLESSYTLLGKVGDVAPFKLALSSTRALCNGFIMLPPALPLTTSGTGTINQLGAVLAGQSLYANLNVLSLAGTTPSITVTVQSATAIGFGSPTTRLTFTAATAAGGQFLIAAGPITDTYWRVSYTISGTSPSILASVALGIH